MPVKKILIFFIRLYQWTIGPFFPKVCIYTPSCSEYAAQAFDRHGSCRGAILTAKRICRCTPLHSGGEDPVP